MLFTRDVISNLFLHQNQYLYLSNRSKNCIQLYHISGLPLNIFTREFGNDFLHDPSSFDRPSKIHIDAHGFLYICSDLLNVVRYNFNHALIQSPFGERKLLDPWLLHATPTGISVQEDERIIVLYGNDAKVGIYTYRGEKLNTLDYSSSSSIPRFIHFTQNFLYILFEEREKGAYFQKYDSEKGAYFQKYDKNGIITNYVGDEYGDERLTLPFSKSIFTQFLPTSISFLLLSSDKTIYQYDLQGYKRENSLSTVAIYPLYFDEKKNTFFYIDASYIRSTKSGILDKIPYHPESPYIPTTNIEVIQLLFSKKKVYQRLMDAYTHSKQYLQENKEYFTLYYDHESAQNVKIASYDLIFILQAKFLLNASEYNADLHVQRFPQHFMLRGKYEYHQSRRNLYISILQTYQEALLFQHLCEELRRVLNYDDYLNLTDNIQMIFDISGQQKLFPRVHCSQWKGFYNKKQCIILQKMLL
jgi:hypothetical protein